MSRCRITHSALIWALATAASAAASAQRTQPDSGAFMALLGRDTVSIERYVRSPTRLQVEAVRRDPQTRLLVLVVEWNEAGRLSAFELLDSAPPGSGGQSRIRTVATAQGDSLRIEVTQSSNQPRVRTIRLGADVPWISPFYSLFETALLRERMKQPDQLDLLTTQGPVSYLARWVGDSVSLTTPIGVLQLIQDASGHLQSLSGGESTFKVQVQPIAWPDIDALAAHFARQPLGLLSPRDTARVNVDGALVVIDYGSPAARGRVIFGELVPWDRVWRTGANAATQLRTNRDLVIGGVTIPAGNYSLWTLPGRRDWQLIINRQTGQWGTAYDPTQDLARIPMQTRTQERLAERFTITIAAEMIRMAWDRTEAVVAFRVR